MGGLLGGLHCAWGAICLVFCMSLGAEDCAFDAGNPPGASEKAKYEEKKIHPICSLLAAFYSFLAQRTLLVLASVDP